MLKSLRGNCCVLGNILGEKLWKRVCGLCICILYDGCSKICFQQWNCWAKELLPFCEEVGKAGSASEREYGKEKWIDWWHLILGEPGKLELPYRVWN